MLGQGKPLYMIFYASGIVFFSFFYTSIIFNPVETSDNLKKNGGFVPGIRPGDKTSEFIQNLLTKLTVIGSTYLVIICLLPEVLISKYPIPFYLGGTSLLNCCCCCNGYNYTSTNKINECSIRFLN